MSEAPAMKITILTIFPEMFESVLNSSILGRARAQGILDIRCVDIRPFSDRKHKNTDDYPFGGGAGMVMMAQPIMAAMETAMGENFQGKRIFMGPRGSRLTTAKARELSQEQELILLCGHYEGVDQRALDRCIDEEISIGDNDTLSAMVAASIRADLLILLSDIDGLYDSDPHENPDARLIPVVERLDDHIRALAGGSGSSLGTGGMVTKLQAAQIATEAGCEMVIANGHHPAALYDIAAGQPAGTRFLAGRKEL